MCCSRYCHRATPQCELKRWTSENRGMQAPPAMMISGYFFKLRDEHKVPDLAVARDSFCGPSPSEVCRASTWPREADRLGHCLVLFMFAAQLEEEEFR